MFRRLIWKTAGVTAYVVQYACIAHCALEYVADVVVCSGPSMQPTIQNRDIVLTEHITVSRKMIQKGDVVIAHSVSNPGEYICKRVVAMEGDRVYNTGIMNSRKYVPKGHVWLEGDNKSNSTDSHNYGPVPYALLRSRVFLKVWPLHDSGRLKDPMDR